MRVLLALVLLPLATLAAEPSPDSAACEAAIAVSGQKAVPGNLLSAIARAESGRTLPDGRAAPWPWTINAAGAGHYYASQPEAVTAAEAFRSKGVQSIDVGCMQINLLHHPQAFATLHQAFDPATNVAYAGRFLASLHAELGDWPQAVAAYHSRTPALGAKYGQRVLGGGSGGNQTAIGLPRVATVDPYGIYTPAFARQLVQDASARNTRDKLLASQSPVRSQITSHSRTVRIASRDVNIPRPASQLRPMLAEQVRLAQADLDGTLTIMRRR